MLFWEIKTIYIYESIKMFIHHCKRFETTGSTRKFFENFENKSRESNWLSMGIDRIMGDFEAHKVIRRDDVVSNLPPNVVVIRNGFVDIRLGMYF